MNGFIVFFGKEECFIHEVDDVNIDIDTHIDFIGAKTKPNRGYKLDIKLKGNLINPDESPTLIMTSLTRMRLGGLSELLFPNKKPIYLETKKQYLQREKKEIARLIKR